MAYTRKVKVNGFILSFGRMFDGSLGVYINFEDEATKEPINNQDLKFFQSLKELSEISEELDAVYQMHGFEHYHLQGHGWHSLIRYHDFASQERYKKMAVLVLSSKIADEEDKKTAQTIIDVLSGNYKFPPPPEKSPEEKAKAAFDRKRDKLKLKIVVERGYKCDNCEHSVENSLCIIRKDEKIHNYEIENLVLRCRSCTSKIRAKDKASAAK